MADNAHEYGRIIAFEGPVDIVTAQLALLPISPQILVLPPLEEYIQSSDDDSTPFNAWTYVLNVHKAAVAREHEALRFIRSSSPSNQRFVILNGGTTRAWTQCISMIRDRQSGDDLLRAEAIFFGLIGQHTTGLENRGRRPGAEPRRCELKGDKASPPGALVEAMRAADALYRQTAFLQLESDASIGVAGKPGVTALSGVRNEDYSGPLHPPGRIKTTVISNSGSPVDSQRPANLESPRPRTASGEINLLRSNHDDPPKDIPYSQKNANEDSGRRLPPATECLPRVATASDVSVAEPASPVVVAVGQAKIVHVRPSSMRMQLPRSVSSDQLYGGKQTTAIVDDKADRQTQSLTSEALETGCRPSKPFRHTISAQASVSSKYDEPKSTISYHRHAIQSIAVKGSFAAIQEHLPTSPNTAREPLLPLTEHLVVYFTGDKSSELMESVIERLREGQTQPEDEPATAKSSGLASLPLTPTSLEFPASHYESGDAGGWPLCNEPDVFSRSFSWMERTREANGNTTVQKQRSISRLAGKTILVRGRPLTPVEPPLSDWTQRFRIFSSKETQSAVYLQNEIRSILRFRFPFDGGSGSIEARLHQLTPCSPIHPWTPVLGREHGGTGRIIAVGAETGVGEEYLSNIKSRVAGIGAGSKGLNFKYLLARSLETCTNRRLSYPEQDSPATGDSLLLASLALPQLELFLAASEHTGLLLLEYPADHLCTILALRELVGGEVFRVASIVDAGTAGCPQVTRNTPDSSLPGSPHPGGRITTANSTARPSFNPKTGCFSFSSSSSSSSCYSTSSSSPSSSKADYLLTSSATEAEIDDFLSTIRRDLVPTASLTRPIPPPPQPSQEPIRSRAVSPCTQTISGYDDVRPTARRRGLRTATAAATTTKTWPLPAPPPTNPPPPTPPSRGRRRPQLPQERAYSPVPSAAARSRSRLSMADAIKTWRGNKTETGGRPSTLGYASSHDFEGDTQELPSRAAYLSGVQQRDSSKKALKWLGLV